MDNSLFIRAALVAEAPALTELALRSKAHWGYSAEFIDACRCELTVSESDINAANLVYRIAERTRRIMGYYALEKLDANYIELEALFVEPTFIGTGIGKQLWHHAMETAGAMGAKQLLIQGDPHAEPFYRAMGCKKIGKKPSSSLANRYLPLFTKHL